MHNKIRMYVARLILGVMAIVVLNACSPTKVFKDSPLSPPTSEEPYTTVYFLRELKEPQMKLARNAVNIEINNQPLMKLSMGEYVMVRLVPTEATVTVKSLSFMGGKVDPVILSGSKTFNFAAGQTNFIRIKLIDEEFRGVYYEPQRIEFNEAREIAKRLRPKGVARKHPIERL